MKKVCMDCTYGVALCIGCDCHICEKLREVQE